MEFLNFSENKDSEQIFETEKKNYISENFYKIRECLDYKIEYDECTSFRGRFNQYFVHGDFLDCAGFKEDFKNCNACLDGNNDACLKVIKSTDDLLERRMKVHMANDVLKKRSEPPKEWNKPLPDYFEQKSKQSFRFLKKSDPNF